MRQLLVHGEFISSIGDPRGKDSSPALTLGEVVASSPRGVR